MRRKIVFISAFCLLMDQFFKCLIDKLLYLNQSITVISSFFSITYVGNEGAAWSILSGRQFFLIMISVLAIFALYYYFIKDKQLNKIEVISYGLLYGGILGNLLDRLFRGYVIDFLDFTIFGYHFPVFNVADICIVIGVLLLMISLWKVDGKSGKNSSREGRKKN